MIKVLVKEVGGKLEEKDLGVSVQAMQEEVGGYFRPINLPLDIVMWVDEEGEIFKKPLNFAVKAGDKVLFAIVGKAVFTGMNMSGDTVSLNEVQKAWLNERFTEGGHATAPEIGAYKVGILTARKEGQ